MATKTKVLLLGMGVGAAVILIRKAARPIGAYALTRGIIAYETACEVIENSGEAVKTSIRKMKGAFKRHAESET
jgi:hypothetical protein